MKLMAKITCNNCNKQWLLQRNEIQFQKYCPFCGIATIKQVEHETTSVDCFKEAVALAMNKLGEDVLLNPTRLSGYVMDVEPSYSKEMRIFKRAIGEQYSTFIKEMYGKDSNDFEFLITRYRTILIDNEGLSSEWGDLICDTLRFVLLNKKMPIQQRIDGVKVEFFEYESEKSETELVELQSDNFDLVDVIYELPSWVKEGLDIICVLKFIKENSSEETKEEIMRFITSKDYCSAVNKLGKLYLEKGKYKEAWQLFSKTAGKGNAEGKQQIKQFYKKGLLGLI